MRALFDHPAVFLPAVILLLFAAGCAGLVLRQFFSALTGTEHRSDLSALQASTLGLLGLLLGFSFSMAVNRYDLRKQLEVDEANAIGTTWLRSDALDEPERSAARNVLRTYVNVRSAFLDDSRNPAALDEAVRRSTQLQAELWRTATSAANLRPDGIRGLYLASVNNSIDLSEKLTAAFENRIPSVAWLLLLFIASSASMLTGLSFTSRSAVLLAILPVIVGAALTLILDLDTPRTGLVQIEQQSMHRVQQQIENTPR